MDAVTISFLNLSHSEESLAAQELAAGLLQMGVPKEELRLQRADPDAQDAGSIIQLLASAATLIAVPLGTSFAEEIAKGIANQFGEDIGKVISKRTRELFSAVSRKFKTAVQVEVGNGRTVIIDDNIRNDDGIPKLQYQRGRLGVILLGASRFKWYSPEKGFDNPAFAASAQLMRDLLSPAHTPFDTLELIDLFDTGADEGDIIEQIDEKIAQRADITDVVLYYCGHADKQPGPSYFPVPIHYMMLQETKPGTEQQTGLILERMIRTLQNKCGAVFNKRWMFILDCCFADAAKQSVIRKDGSTYLPGLVLPRVGSTFLTASHENARANGKGSRGATMFTGAFADVLLSTPSKARSLRSLHKDMCELLRKNRPNDAVLPQLHSMDQPEGDIAELQIFEWKAIVENILGPRTPEEIAKEDARRFKEDNRNWSGVPTQSNSGTISYVDAMNRDIRSSNNANFLKPNHHLTEQAVRPDYDAASQDVEVILATIRKIVQDDQAEGVKHNAKPFQHSKTPTAKINPTLTTDLPSTQEARRPVYTGGFLGRQLNAKNAVPDKDQQSLSALRSDSTADRQWYVVRDQKQHGPLNNVEILTFIHHEYLTPTDLIWKPGMKEWKLAPVIFPEAFKPTRA